MEYATLDLLLHLTIHVIVVWEHYLCPFCITLIQSRFSKSNIPGVFDWITLKKKWAFPSALILWVCWIVTPHSEPLRVCDVDLVSMKFFTYNLHPVTHTDKVKTCLQADVCNLHQLARSLHGHNFIQSFQNCLKNSSNSCKFILNTGQKP